MGYTIVFSPTNFQSENEIVFSPTKQVFSLTIFQSKCERHVFSLKRQLINLKIRYMFSVWNVLSPNIGYAFLVKKNCQSKNEIHIVSLKMKYTLLVWKWNTCIQSESEIHVFSLLFISKMKYGCLVRKVNTHSPVQECNTYCDLIWKIIRMMIEHAATNEPKISQIQTLTNQSIYWFHMEPFLSFCLCTANIIKRENVKFLLRQWGFVFSQRQEAWALICVLSVPSSPVPFAPL